MTITPGTRLGAYEIVAPLGSGGMGEVYRALDARLGREVAVKVLPASVSSDPAALARFEREARAVGALSHPNIISIYDVGTEHGISYVVMELLEGETLRARLEGTAASPATVSTRTPPPGGSVASRAGGLPRAKALEMATQIAQGLAAAHGKGIVHRDLKPENVFVTADGRVKILDFGLARAVPGAQAISEAHTAMSPHTAGASVPGLILGTVGYMAPEQVRGQTADHRADIFAFGAVLFEMLTGTRAFGGDSAIEMMGAILKQDPLDHPSAAVALTGPLEPLLRHCLEKQPDERFQSARDLAFQLHVIASGSSASSASAAGIIAPGARRSWRRFVVPAIVALAAAVVGLGLGRYLFAPGVTEPTTLTSTILLPADVRVFPGPNPARSGGLAVSRDGRQIAFVGQTSKGRQIFVRAIDSQVARPVAGTEGGEYPVWSPDGRRLAFVQDLKLKQIPSDGGAALVITDMANPRSAAAWGPDDTLLFHLDYRQPLSRVSVAGGPASEVLPRVGADVSWFSPVWLPDGRRFLVIRFPYADAAKEGAGIYAGSVDSKDATLLIPGRIAEVALGRDELFYRKGTELIAQPFDSSTLKLSGNPRVISSHVSMVAAGGPTLVYFDPPGGLSLGHRIAWFSPSGAVLSTTGEAASFRDPRVSPDGRSIVIARADENGLFGIWKYDIQRNIDTRVTGTTFVSPAWSHDGRSIIVGNGSGVHRFDASAAGPPELIRATKTFVGITDISPPDGREALLTVSTLLSASQPSVMPLDGRADPRPVSAEQPTSAHPAFSPDGKWIALDAVDVGGVRLHVQPYPGPGARIPVTATAARFPRWRGDSRELYFLSQVDGQNAIMAVPVTWTGGVPDFGAVRTLFKVPKLVVSNLGFDVTKDGQKFLAVVGGDLDPSPLTMVIRAVVR
jgi:serine/threonine protein kinase/Tol biopolymer transport system component